MELNWRNFMSDPLDIWWKLVIRPPRKKYELNELGNQTFRFGNKNFKRKDIQVLNGRGLKLECSHFVPLEEPVWNRPCVIYIHGNSSSRLEAAGPLRVLLPLGVTVFCFDSSGSGRSEGDYISLGHYEEKDLQAVIQYLRMTSSASRIAVWGRSTGAVASIMRASDDPGIVACVLDSPFSSFRAVAEEMAGKGAIAIPGLLMEMVLKNMREEIHNRASFDIEELVPIDKAPKAGQPALFAVAQDDVFVSPQHTEKLFHAWGGKEKKKSTFTGGHNGSRPLWFLEEAAEFLHKSLQQRSVPKAMYGNTIGEVEWLFDVDDGDSPRDIAERSQSLPVPSAAKVAGSLAAKLDGIGKRLIEMGTQAQAASEEAVQVVPSFSNPLFRAGGDPQPGMRLKASALSAGGPKSHEQSAQGKDFPPFGVQILHGGEILTNV